MTNKRSRDVRTQLHVWSKLLEGRIALQKVAVSVRELEKVEQQYKHDGTSGDDPMEGSTITDTDESTVKSVTKLLKCLVLLRDTYRRKSQFCTEKDESPQDDESVNCVDDAALTRKHEDYNGIRDDTITKWCEKTKIGTIPKKGYVALELPTLQLIQNAFKDKERLIRRTQLDRTSHKDDAYHHETFNDDDFYHNLLKEMISKDESRKWVELQRIRYKNKRKAETRATKGRKIKKDLIPKLVNFMAPSRTLSARDDGSGMPDQIRDELIKSLFGGSVTSRGNRESDDDDDQKVVNDNDDDIRI